jgi:hypothetical protein
MGQIGNGFRSNYAVDGTKSMRARQRRIQCEIMLKLFNRFMELYS